MKTNVKWSIPVIFIYPLTSDVRVCVIKVFHIVSDYWKLFMFVIRNSKQHVFLLFFIAFFFIAFLFFIAWPRVWLDRTNKAATESSLH